MLITKKYSANDIVAIKLNSGEEILTKIVEIKEDGTIVATKAFTMVLMQGAQGQGAVTFAPFMLGADDDAKIELSKDKFIVIVKARADAAAQYIQATTGLEMPPAGMADLSNIIGKK